MKTNFTPNYPQEGYTATIKLTVTRKEILALYDMLKEANPSDTDGQDIKDDVLYELRCASDWLWEMEDIHRQMQKYES